MDGNDHRSQLVFVDAGGSQKIPRDHGGVFYGGQIDVRRGLASTQCGRNVPTSVGCDSRSCERMEHTGAKQCYGWKCKEILFIQIRCVNSSIFKLERNQKNKYGFRSQR